MRPKKNPRREEKLREVVGLHSCREALKVRPSAVKELWLEEGWERLSKLAWFGEEAKKKKIPVKTVGSKKLDQLCWGHQGVACLVTENPQFNFESLRGDGSKCLILLDGIVDPQNLGAMIRTSWLMRVDALFVTKDRAVGLTPSVCKVASGGVEHLPVVVENNFVQLIKSLKELGFWVYSLAEKDSESIYQQTFPEKVAWVVGAEDKGIRGAVLKESDVRVNIPQVASGSSYNASVALAIALSETMRSR